MLNQHIGGFIAYCKVSGFKAKSIESLSMRLNEFNTFVRNEKLEKIKGVPSRHLRRFVADYRKPTIHVKKSWIWSLRQFYHPLKLNGHVDENISTALAYLKIEKTVPHLKK
jgi:integrase/recombinase XerC